MKRSDGRSPDAFRKVGFERNFISGSPGAVLVAMGRTRVLCTASVEPGVPKWLERSGRGWLTAEYAMLPASTGRRKPRDRAGKVDGRSIEIQRLLGRSLRAMIDLSRLGEQTIWVDCDVIEADGGTRTAAITGACVAVVDAVEAMRKERLLRKGEPVLDLVAAVSVGVVEGTVVTDLCYEEDSRAEVDMNVVMTGSGQIIEVQGTAEGKPFPRETLDQMMDAASSGIRRLIEEQRGILGHATLPA